MKEAKGEFKEKTSADQKEHVGWSHIVQKHLDEPQVWTDETKMELFGKFKSQYLVSNYTAFDKRKRLGVGSVSGLLCQH